MGRIGVPEVIVMLVIPGLFVAYFLPTLIAILRKKTNLLPIIAVNLFLGWSVIGWIIALVWALSTQLLDEPRTTATMPAAKLCAHCGKYNAPTLRFCGHCGQAFVTSGTDVHPP